MFFIWVIACVVGVQTARGRPGERGAWVAVGLMLAGLHRDAPPGHLHPDRRPRAGRGRDRRARRAAAPRPCAAARQESPPDRRPPARDPPAGSVSRGSLLSWCSRGPPHGRAWWLPAPSPILLPCVTGGVHQLAAWCVRSATRASCFRGARCPSTNASPPSSLPVALALRSGRRRPAHSLATAPAGSAGLGRPGALRPALLRRPAAHVHGGGRRGPAAPGPTATSVSACSSRRCWPRSS